MIDDRSDTVSPPKQGRRRSRIGAVLLWGGAAPILLLAATGFAAWQARLPLADAYGPDLASQALGQPVRFEVTALSFDRIVLQHVRIGEEGPLARRVEARGALLTRRIDHLTIDGLQATLAQGPDGAPAIKGLVIPESGVDAGAAPPALLDRLTLNALSLTIDTPAGPHLLQGRAAFTGLSTPDAPPALDLDLQDSAGGGRVTLSATVGDGAAVTGSVDLDPAVWAPLIPGLEAAQGRLAATVDLSLDTYPDRLSTVLDGASLSLDLRPAGLSLTLAELGTLQLSDTPISVTGSNGRVFFEAGPDISLTLDRPPPALRDAVSAVIPRAASAPITLTPASGAVLSGVLKNREDGFEITSNGAVHIVNGPVSFTITPTLSWSPGAGGAVVFAETAAARVAPGALAQGMRLRRPLDIALRRSARLTLSPAGRVTLDASLAVQDVALTLPGGERLDLFLPDLRPRLTADGAALPFTGAAVHWAAGDVTATQIEGGIEGPVDGPYSLSLRVPEVIQAGAPLVAGESAVEGDVAADGAGGWRFDGTLFNADRRIETQLTATLPGDSAAPTFSFATAPIRYRPDGMQPGALSPLAAGLFQEVEGALSLAGDATVAPDGLHGAVVVRLDRLGFKSGLAQLRELSGEIRVDLARAPATAPAQRLSARVAVAGLPAAAIDLTFALDDRARLLIDRLAVETLGGEALVRDARYDPLENSFTGAVDLSGLSLGQALASLGVEGLEGDGRLTGSFPITVTASDKGDGPPEVTVTQGRIAAEAPGVLRIDNPSVQDYLGGRNQAVDMMVEALKDFRYDRLSADLDIRPDGAGDLKLSIFGRNPAVLQGQPFDLNITVETDFAKLFGTLAEAFSTTDALLERLARRAR